MPMQEKRPVLLRTIIVLVVIGVFAYSTYPLQERNFYETFLSALKKADKPEAGQKIAAEAQSLVDDARARQAKDPSLFDSNALLAAANDKGVLLTDLVNIPPADDNRVDIGWRIQLF